MKIESFRAASLRDCRRQYFAKAILKGGGKDQGIGAERARRGVGIAKACDVPRGEFVNIQGGTGEKGRRGLRQDRAWSRVIKLSGRQCWR